MRQKVFIKREKNYVSVKGRGFLLEVRLGLDVMMLIILMSKEARKKYLKNLEVSCFMESNDLRFYFSEWNFKK